MQLRAAITIGALLAAQGQASAQTAAAQASSSAAMPLAGASCLSRPFLGANGASQPHTIYVPSGEVSIYQAKGFVPAACGPVSLEVHRARVCHLAIYGNDAVQRRFQQVLGAKPKDLCASAKKVAPFPTAAN